MLVALPEVNTVSNNVNGGSVGPQNVYNLPVGRGKRFMGSASRAADLAVGGWVLNVVSVISSGYPLQISQNSNNNSAFFGGASQRPNATGVTPSTPGDVGQRIDNWINRAAFSPAPALTYGNVSRTITLRGPGIFNWDISLFKNFTVYERFRAQFRVEGLNAFNTPLFRSPNTSYQPTGGSFGQVLSQGNFPRFVQLA